MIDFSRLSRSSVAGTALRSALNVLPLPKRLRILQGPLRGATWIRASGTAGCWLGSYEIEKQRSLAAVLSPGKIFYDVGAHAGLYTLLGGKAVGPTGKVIAFEPDPRNLANLRSHIELNGLANARVIAAAVAATTGDVGMTFSDSSYENRMSPDGKQTVSCYSLDDAISQLGLPIPDCIKIDVEGAEEDVLMGAVGTLSRVRPTLFVAMHSLDLRSRCSRILKDLDYRLTSVGGGSWKESDELLALP